MAGNIAEILEIIGEVKNDLSSVEEVVKNAANLFCRHVVERNNRLTSIGFCREDKDRHQMAISAISEFSRDDQDQLNSEGMVVFHSMNAQGSLDALKEAIGGLEAMLLADKEMAERLAMQLRSQLEALQARVKLHALHDEAVRAQVWDITGGKCFYCECDLVRGPECEGDSRSNVFHVDHLVPKSAGGPDHLTNYVPSCQTCNISKSDKPVAVFMASRRQPKLTLVASS